MRDKDYFPDRFSIFPSVTLGGKVFDLALLSVTLGGKVYDLSLQSVALGIYLNLRVYILFC
jgi:hypothetical protein